MKHNKILLILTLILFQFFNATGQRGFHCDFRFPIGISAKYVIKETVETRIGEFRLKQVSNSKLYQIVDSSGAILFDSLLECKAVDLGKYVFKNNKGKWGAINEKAEVLIPALYDDLFYQRSSPGLDWAVELDRKYGVVDSLNNIKIPIEYDQINSIFQPVFILKKGKNKELYHIDSHKKVDIKDYCFKTISKGKGIDESFYIKSNDSIGVMNFDGELIVEPKFTTISRKQAGKIRYYQASNGSEVGAFSLSGEVIFEPIYNRIVGKMCRTKLEECVYLGIKDTLSIIYYNGKKDKVDFDDLEMKKSLAKESLVYQRGDLFGIYNYKEFKIVTEPIYKSIRVLSDHFFLVNEEENIKLFSVKNNRLIGWRFDELPKYYKVEDRAYWHVVDDKKVGLVDENLKFVLEPQFNTLNNFRLGVGCFSIRGRWGMINEKLEYQLDPIYDYVATTNVGDIFIKQDGKCSYIDKTGKIIGDCNL